MRNQGFVWDEVCLFEVIKMQSCGLYMVILLNIGTKQLSFLCGSFFYCMDSLKTQRSKCKNEHPWTIHGFLGVTYPLKVFSFPENLATKSPPWTTNINKDSPWSLTNEGTWKHHPWLLVGGFNMCKSNQLISPLIILRNKNKNYRSMLFTNQYDQNQISSNLIIYVYIYIHISSYIIYT